MDKIPIVLRQFVETHEKDGTSIECCDEECRAWILTIRPTHTPKEQCWSLVEGIYRKKRVLLNISCIGDSSVWCPGCGCQLGFLSDGTPYRIRHSRVVEALEQALEAVVALEWAAVRDRVGVRTALAATEEAARDA